MDNAERDSTQDWLLPPGSAPPSMRELEQRVDVALAIARSSEETVSKVGDAALEASRQARRAAELAESASAAALAASRAVAAPAPVVSEEPPAPEPPPLAEVAEPPVEDTAVWEVPAATPVADEPAPPIAFEPEAPPPDPDASLRRFSDHADRVVARLRALDPVA